jgi:hypothetical protein
VSAKRGRPLDLERVLREVQARLREQGIEASLGAAEACCAEEGSPRVKVVCVAPGLADSVRELGAKPRDQVVMVRVDESTSRALDAWVETDAVRSRSEAAALFIREGLRVRADELDRLRDALGEVERARAELQRRAREVFGATEAEPDSAD